MKRIAVLLVLVILVSTPLSVQAATPRILSIRPGISFSGNIATCTAPIMGDSSSDRMEAVIKLWRGSSCIETWEASGNGYIFFSETANATKGHTYTLTVDLSVNGVAQDTVSFSKKYE